ncbi:MAG: T9SS type A sorting domain-containing protein [Cytophagales bacterium]|nr:T9SS type A sorting domain-containing protein [Cytophagales bacterium]
MKTIINKKTAALCGSFVAAIALTNFSFAQQVIFFEDFSTAAGSTPPAGWDTLTQACDPALDIWYFDNPNSRPITPPIDNFHAIFDSKYNDCQYPGVSSCCLVGTCSCFAGRRVILKSPVFNASALDTVWLRWDQSLQINTGDSIIVDVFNGTSWVRVWDTLSPGMATPLDNSKLFNIFTIVSGVSNAQVRFIFSAQTSGGESYWMIDNVHIYVSILTANAGIDVNINCMDSVVIGGTPTAFGGSGIYTYSWTPSSGLNDPTLANPTASPFDTTTYTVTVLDTNGSTASDSVTVNIIAPLPQPICIITIDSTSTKNIIVWEKPVSPVHIDSIRIYRNILGSYTHIGSAFYNSLSVFVDTSNIVDPQATSYRYKLSVIDSCGNESALGDFHETIHLLASPGTGNEINLTWDAYEGFTFNFYTILRYNQVSGNFDSLASVLSTNFTYTDWSPPQQGNVKYVIEVIPPSICTPSLKATIYNSVRSNISNVDQPSYINQYLIFNSYFTIYPNPNNGQFKLKIDKHNNGNLSIALYQINGKLIFSQSLPDRKSKVSLPIDLSKYVKGIYYLQIVSDREVVTKKVIYQ